MQFEGRITTDPAICNGKPVIRGMRITVRTVLEYLAADESMGNLLQAYPVLEAEDILAALAYAATVVEGSQHSIRAQH